MIRFSSRIPWSGTPNPLTAALAARREAGLPVLDLTETNPTRAGFAYDEGGILAALADPGGLRYDPDPRGLPAAREAVAAYYRGHRRTVDPARVVLTAGTSEAYGFLFKLLGDPGDEILVPAPSYPLFEYLVRLEGLRPVPYRLLHLPGHGWRMDREGLERAMTPRTRAVVAVSPNNPTGTLLHPEDRAAVAALCASRGAALVVDEVFLDYPAPGAAPESAVDETAVLTFVLSGFSKVLALPQVKLSWIVVAGPPREADEARARLEFVADTYLGVGTPVQRAAPGSWPGERRSAPPSGSGWPATRISSPAAPGPPAPSDRGFARGDGWRWWT